MAQLTLAADIAWRFGANEALSRGSTTLEPADLLIGILAIEKVFSQDLAERMKITEYGLSTVRVEWQETLKAVALTGASPAVLRREIRAQIPRTESSVQNADKPKVSRSEVCKAVFAKAGELAQSSGSHVAGIRYFLYALVDGAPLDVSNDLYERIVRMKLPLSDVVGKPLHTPINTIEDGYVSEHAIAPTIDRRRAKA
jgi:hypothetical protein